MGLLLSSKRLTFTVDDSVWFKNFDRTPSTTNDKGESIWRVWTFLPQYCYSPPDTLIRGRLADFEFILIWHWTIIIIGVLNCCLYLHNSSSATTRVSLLNTISNVCSRYKRAKHMYLRANMMHQEPTGAWRRANLGVHSGVSLYKMTSFYKNELAILALY